MLESGVGVRCWGQVLGSGVGVLPVCWRVACVLGCCLCVGGDVCGCSCGRTGRPRCWGQVLGCCLCVGVLPVCWGVARVLGVTCVIVTVAGLGGPGVGAEGTAGCTGRPQRGHCREYYAFVLFYLA